MNNDRQNLMIHLARGPINIGDIHEVTGRGYVYTVRTDRGLEERQIPNYVNDLNAMHEAWATLTVEQHRQFRRNLQLVVVRDGHISGPVQSVSNATAAQRAEAFLRTINKWEEGT